MMPKLEDLMGPILAILSDGRTYHKSQLAERMAAEFNLTSNEKKQTVPSGQSRISNRVVWACVELKGAGLITTKESKATITKEGEALYQKSGKIDYKLLRSVPKYRAWLKKNQYFSFTGKDFDSMTGTRDDAKYLSARFRHLLKILKKHLPDGLKESKSYVASASGRPDRNGNVTYKDCTWLGLAMNPVVFTRVQESIQFQVSLEKNSLSCFIWASWVARNRILFLQKQFGQDPERFQKILRDLPDGYAIGAGARETDMKEIPTAKITRTQLDEIFGTLGEKNTEFYLGRSWDRRDAIKMDKDIVTAVCGVLEALLPAYLFLNGLDGTAPNPPSGPLLPPSRLEDYKRMLQKTPQIILYGPPGTGKTYTAGMLASHITGNNGPDSKFVRHVTFHPSYSYEEFVEGIKPDSSGSFHIKDGIFKQACSDARSDPANKYVLVIDEINRGRTEKIFGELITLIEGDKRARRSAHLAYSQEELTVPENLMMIGTMNTADRSLTFLDAALRRRFGFYELMPDYSLIKSTAGDVPLGKLLAGLNSRVRVHAGREKQIGHSYLMSGGGPMQTIEEVRYAFTHEIIPLLQDYFYEDYDKLEEVLGKTLVDSKNLEMTAGVLSDSEFTDALKKICDEDNQDK